ncbi:MAG TPA: hypothetical protein VFS23_38210 [Vicinamibacterales bacterium]|nr:hypothetical protein [Vicinamibacterales bacterium]
MVHVYEMLLRLYPEDFRRRYGAEMALDFEDAFGAARTEGWRAVGVFAQGAAADLAVSLLREWMRSGRLAIAAAAAAVTLALWALALRPWMWRWDIQPGPPAQARTPPPVSEIELLVLAAVAMVPVVVIMLFANRLVRPRRR